MSINLAQDLYIFFVVGNILAIEGGGQMEFELLFTFTIHNKLLFLNIFPMVF